MDFVFSHWLPEGMGVRLGWPETDGPELTVGEALGLLDVLPGVLLEGHQPPDQIIFSPWALLPRAVGRTKYIELHRGGRSVVHTWKGSWLLRMGLRSASPRALKGLAVPAPTQVMALVFDS